ncbi:MAG: TonB family protein [Patescibacteria group bacterium]|nr:TonB family protein [Patescibacteria group bacterium]
MEYVLPYLPPGATELKKVLQKYALFGIIVATIIFFALIGVYWGADYLSAHQVGPPPAHVIKIVKYSELGPPPSITPQEVAPSVSVSGPVAKPSIGLPVPVPDAAVNPEQSFASQTELSSTGPVTDGAAIGTGATIDVDVEVEEPPPAFVPFEKEPVCVKKVEPLYPEIAQKAGLTGKVIAYLWVDKQGKVREVKIMKSDSEIFNQAVIDAAKQYVFTPAMMKNGPVSVWISVPFSFELK